MAERKQRHHAHATAEPAQTTTPAAEPLQRGAGAMAPASKGPTASDQAYGDATQMDSMRLQMAMDRRSKSAETLSNMEKKESDTSEDITKNMK